MGKRRRPQGHPARRQRTSRPDPLRQQATTALDTWHDDEAAQEASRRVLEFVLERARLLGRDHFQVHIDELLDEAAVDMLQLAVTATLLGDPDRDGAGYFRVRYKDGDPFVRFSEVSSVPTAQWAAAG